MMEYYPEKVLKNPEFAALSGKYVEMYTLSPKEFIEHTYTHFKRSIEPGKKAGVGRFESILNAVGLGGGVDKEIKNFIYEMYELRHNLVHRMGIVDAKLLKACPNIGLRKGSRFALTENLVICYADCLRYYLLEIESRFSKFDGKPVSERSDHQKKWHLDRFLWYRNGMKNPKGSDTAKKDSTAAE